MWARVSATTNAAGHCDDLRRFGLPARRHGPQIVTRHGREEVVVIAVEDYRRLARKQKGLVAFMSESPLAEALAGGELEIRRSRDLPRDIVL